MTTIKRRDPDNPGQWIRVAGGSFFWRGTKAAYDALPTKDPALLYVIEDASGSAWMTEAQGTNRIYESVLATGRDIGASFEDLCVLTLPRGKYLITSTITVAAKGAGQAAAFHNQLVVNGVGIGNLAPVAIPSSDTFVAQSINTRVVQIDTDGVVVKSQGPFSGVTVHVVAEQTHLRALWISP